MYRSIGSSLAVFVLAGCSGSGGDAVPDPAPANPPAPVPDQQLGGLWVGTSTNNIEPGVVSTLIAVSTDDGRVRFITDDSVQGKATVSVSESQLTGTMTQFAPIGFVFLNGLTVATGTVSGTVSERASFSGDWTLSTGEAGDFTLVYDQLHTIGSSLATTAGTWIGFDQFNVAELSITIANDGGIVGQDIFGCIYSGAVSIIDPQFNVYDLAVTISNCGSVDGSYSGLGAYDDSDDAFRFQIDSSNYVFTDVLMR
jgi:hypothetical protein